MPTTLQNDISDKIEFGEAILTLLKRKAECHLELIAPAQDEQVVELWRMLLAMHEVEAKLLQERYRLSLACLQPPEHQ